jgi:hypothetical protein
VQPWGIASIRTDKADKDLLIGRPDVVQHSLAPYQDQLISLLQGVVQHGTGRAAALQGFARAKPEQRKTIEMRGSLVSTILWSSACGSAMTTTAP